ncbi:hypothetical protein [Streptomyces montanisoli]|uniref:Uncharacterized protein n=1 Tax=Streptomyces montanisoli TaxID=2798581 RepID=A0A940M8R3_9ACTN|nr:hypothetical protein [Streptomyces montanisoli]MBP0458339.1 hypothetical protein [Streptomyces montanisoli]
MNTARTVRRLAPILLAASLLTACSAGHDGTSDGASSPAADVSTSPAAVHAPASAAPIVAGDSDSGSGATGSGSPSSSGTAAGYPTTERAPGALVPAVRDSFAVLQATYNDGCTTPGNCEYFLNRLVSNLDDLYDSMKASPEGDGHFAAPIARIRAMQQAFKGDFSFPNLKQHKQLLTTTRDKVNTWMQGHPEDYR